MKFLIINRGSSSIKCCLYDFESHPDRPIDPIWQAELQEKDDLADPKKIIRSLFEGKGAPLKSKDELSAIGHRIVHGGKYFSESVFVTVQVKDKIRILSELAPLHNPAQLESIEILEQVFKNVPQIAVFDTAFHQSLPDSARIYPGPYNWFENDIIRYGFHGISFQYCSKRAAQMVSRDAKSLKMVVCHLGAGASLCAIKDGQSIDTTMGFTPLDGLMMDTRCGSVDPGIILYLLGNRKKSVEELSHELYEQSGLLGISGVSADMRDIEDEVLEGNTRAILAFDIYIHRLNALVSSMIVALQGADLLVFTAGIGENSALVREKVCEAFSFLGVKLDAQMNNIKDSLDDRIISTGDSKLKVLLVHTREDFEIARECFKKMKR